jgi:hypothetical protein
MKKLLMAFICLDLIFVGVVLQLNSEKSRGLASTQTSMTEGQQQKKELIQSLTFQNYSDRFVLATTYLQAICASYAHISLQFKALHLAVSGTAPTITSSFSCSQILREPGQTELTTLHRDFHAAHSRLPTTGYVRARGTFPDDPIEKDWQLSAIIVGGGSDTEASQFTVTEAELQLFGKMAEISF